MEAVKGLTGLGVVEQTKRTNEAFEPLLKAHQQEILSFEPKTYRYGSTDRHEASSHVYFPKTTATGSAAILFFVYGGAYVTGAKVLEPPYDLQHKNTGAFFAKQGFVTVIADYRLFPGIKFPDPATDIKDALEWIVINIDKVHQSTPVKADASQIFLMGHSAGATTVATLMLTPELLPYDVRKRIVAVVLNAGVYDLRGEQTFHPLVVREYYGATQALLRRREPLGLLENAPPDVLEGFPPVLAVLAEFDFQPIIVAHKTFVAALKDRIEAPVEELIMKGHNHMSPYNCLFSGEGEQWALDSVAWLKSKIR
ncbi:hypothetical protein NM688_g4299 [Phlebia brevispora]|uniref:Uncharacterized protein n=1 Tax=Phlebia brevispora TaxID=194682 RepID=A0ACC1T3C3_9APHY|nr:hypothetical protein NM688_g4299 [Phlebia brevispora]